MRRIAGFEIDGWVANQGRFFARGLYRLAKWFVGAFLAVLAFNVIGYLTLTYDLFIGDTLRFGYFEWYWLRVLLLAFVGFLNTAAFVVSIVLAGALLTACYFWILRVGGYRGKS